MYSHLNALQLSTSVHRRCSVTFKTHQICLHTHAMSSPHSLVGWDLGQGGLHDERLPRTPQTFALPLLYYIDTNRMCC